MAGPQGESRSLIQTAGRAARNVDGRVILYADKVTGSMQRAIDETERRRRKQLEFNAEHDITPKTVQKNVADIMEAAYPGAPTTARRFAKVAEQTTEYAAMTPAQMSRRVKELEKQMYRHARDLEFEEAARIRDELFVLSEAGELWSLRPTRERPRAAWIPRSRMPSAGAANTSLSASSWMPCVRVCRM